MMYYEKKLIRLLFIVSDEPTIEQFKQYLQATALNIELFIANSGEAGISCYHESEFDCVIVDHELDDMNAQMVLALMQDGPTLNTPTIVVASIEFHNLDLEILESGAVEFLSKNICNPLLLKRVILYALVRAQYIRSQQEFLSSQKQLEEHQLFYEEKCQMEKLKFAKDKAEQENRAKSEFLSNMSHELRTPLNAILGFAQLLTFRAADPLTKRQSDNIHEIVVAGEHLLNLINDILDLSKIEAGKMDLQLERVNVQSVMRQCIKLTDKLACSNACRVIYECGNEALVLADHTRLKQVILNLLTNGIKYNKPQGTVDIRCFKLEQDRLRIEVKDTGIGIAEANFDQVFEPFSRLGADALAIEGTGIGLTLSKKLLLEMNGSIGFDSVVGQGSCFWLELPLFNDPLAIIEPEHHRQGALLYLDGNEDNIQLMGRHCEAVEELTLLAANNIDLAVQMMRQFKPTMIIVDTDTLDVSMGEIIRELYQPGESHGIQSIALTSNERTEHISAGIDAGFDQVLLKPLAFNELVKIAKFSVNGRYNNEQIGKDKRVEFVT